MKPVTKTSALAPAPNVAAATKVSTAVKAAVQAFVKKEGEMAVALDNVRSVAKTETTKHGWTKQMLTAQLIDCGLDNSRASEVCGFVFPVNSAAREHLDAAVAFNAKQTDLKKRIAKPVLLALQRDKTGTLTLEKAVEEHKAAQTLKGGTRTPGGSTNQTDTSKTKAKTPAEVEEELKGLINKAMTYAKENGYDGADFNAVAEEISEKVFAEEENTDSQD